MQNVSQFLKQMDESQQEAILESLAAEKRETITLDEITQYVDLIKIDPFKRQALVEYLDANRDKLLARVQFNESDPVKISDDFAPMAGKHGVVMARGVGNTFRVKFDDSELDIPEEHLIHNPAPAGTDYPTSCCTESKALALSIDGSLTEVVIETEELDIKQLEEQLKFAVMVVMPVVVSEELNAEYNELAELTLTEEQTRIREDIMLVATSSVDKLQETYGDEWTTVLYGAATMQALEKAPAPIVESMSDPVFNHTTPDGDHIKIFKVDDKFKVTVEDKHGAVIEEKDFSTIDEADKLAQSFM